MEPNMIGAYGPWAAGLAGDGPARLSFRRDQVPAAVDRRLARAGATAAARCLLQPETGRSPKPDPAPARLRRPARRAPELAAPLRAADRGRLPQAGRRKGRLPGSAWAARPWRQQVLRLAARSPG